VEALRSGVEWDVTFLPFSLSQMHVEEGDASVWDEPGKDTGLLALRVSVVVRDRHPEQFLDFHQRTYDLRHVEGGDLRDPEALAGVLRAVGLDPDEVLAEAAEDWTLAAVRDSHEGYAASHGVWGVPTFVAGEDAVFVRLMEGPDGDPKTSVTTIERILELIVGWPQLNEFKHTRVRR
jgi:predicted DsbA family dithiol-disulfide isomerase